MVDLKGVYSSWLHDHFFQCVAYGRKISHEQNLCVCERERVGPCMSYKFRFVADDGSLDFSRPLETVQCKAVSARTGAQCGRNVCIGIPYCFHHMRAIMHLDIRKSRIPNAGNGLFALAAFAAGDFITEYGGAVTTHKALDDLYGNHTAPYAVCVICDEQQGTEHIEDAACHRGIGSISNHGSAAEANAEYAWCPMRKCVILRAIRNIANGDEILCNYGDAYDIIEQGTKSYTYHA